MNPSERARKLEEVARKHWDKRGFTPAPDDPRASRFATSTPTPEELADPKRAIRNLKKLAIAFQREHLGFVETLNRLATEITTLANSKERARLGPLPDFENISGRALRSWCRRSVRVLKTARSERNRKSAKMPRSPITPVLEALAKRRKPASELWWQLDGYTDDETGFEVISIDDRRLTWMADRGREGSMTLDSFATMISRLRRPRKST